MHSIAHPFQCLRQLQSQSPSRESAARMLMFRLTLMSEVNDLHYFNHRPHKGRYNRPSGRSYGAYVIIQYLIATKR